jgi:ketosteroid isomerase-like protein
MTAQEARNTELARSIFKALDRGDIKYFCDMFDPEAEVSVMGENAANWIKTGADMIKANQGVGGDSGEWKYNIYYVTAQDDRVALEAESLYRVPANGKLYNNEYHFLLKFKNDKVVLWREYSDMELVSRVLFNGAPPAIVMTEEERIARFHQRRKEWPQD